jgi:hypothetical protein
MPHSKQPQNIFLHLQHAFTPASCLAYVSPLKMEAIYSSETSDDLQRTTRNYIPQERTLHFPVYIVKQSVGTAHINSGADQSQFRSQPMLSNGWINTFPSNEVTRVNSTRFHGSSSANTQ